MSTAPLSQPAGSIRGAFSPPLRRALTGPRTLAVFVLSLTLYAAFSHGAASLSASARTEVLLATLAAPVGAAVIWGGALRFAAPRLALGGFGLLVAFALWCGLTLLWSVAPEQTWTEVNHTLGYCSALALAIVLGASLRRAPRLIAPGFLVVCAAVTADALAQKVLPGLRLAGVFDFNQTGPLPRLQQPFGYWNALALFIALGVPCAAAIAADRDRRREVRTAALLAVAVMIVTLALTYSRGGVIAVLVGLAVALALGGSWLRGLMWLAAGVLGAVPATVLGLVNHDLTTAGVSLAHRERAGLVLLAVLVLSSLVLLGVAGRLIHIEERIRVGPEQRRRVARALAAGAAVLLLVAVIAVAFSARGLTGTVSHAWHTFTTTRSTSNDDPARLLSADSQNRWVWWKEAAAAFSDRPLAGWGAGSFGVVHLLYRRDTLSVSQPHSVPLQFLVETGVVGAVLALGAFALLLAAGARYVRRLPSGSERLAAAALLGGAAAYAVHALYDWDWDIPALTIAALLFLGVLAGAASGAASPDTSPGRRRYGARGLAVAGLTLTLCVVAVSAALPSLAADDLSAALLDAAAATPSALRHALAEARLAARLDPLSDGGWLLQATIAARKGQLPQARSELLAAAAREPNDGSVWGQLAYVEERLGDGADAARAARRVLALDPMRPGAQAYVKLVAEQAALERTPPAGSAPAAPRSSR